MIINSNSIYTPPVVNTNKENKEVEAVKDDENIKTFGTGGGEDQPTPVKN